MSETSNPIAYTSKIMAAVRAVEHQRPDRLFTDPFAAKLAGEDALIKAIPKIQEYEERGTPYVAVRTRYFDDWLLSLVENITQVVILGAGLDTRAFRLDLPSNIHLYELDQSEVIETKNTLLQDASPKCHRHTIAIDLRQSWLEKLLEHGYELNQPTAWLIEGLLYYLTEPEVHRILQTINDLIIDKSYLATDLINQEILKSDDDLAQYWQYGCDNPESLLKGYGWQASIVQPGEKTAHYGRYTFQFPPLDVQDTPRVFFVTASKIINE